MGKHFYTTYAGEASGAISSSGYSLEMVSCYVFPVSDNIQPPFVALYHAYNKQINDHFYTTNPKEADDAIGAGYQPAGIACVVYQTNMAPAGTVKLRRFYNATTGEHFYTANPNEAQTVMQDGFKEEGSPGIGAVYDLNQTSAPEGTIHFIVSCQLLIRP